MKVLIAEDEPISRRVLTDALVSWGYEVVVTKRGDEAWEVLKSENSPNLVILDWMMPGMDGVEICQKVRSQYKPNYVYIILLTARNRKEDIIEGLESGADDYMVKPFYYEELKYRLKIGERIVELEQRIMKMAMTDYLTGLLNRRAFMERLMAELKRANREKTCMGIIIADIDHFKDVNDTYGHQAGDKILQDFSRCLSLACREYDFIGRYGGEEFIICLPGADEEHTLSTAERLRQAVEKNCTLLANGTNKVFVTASFGVAAINAGQHLTIDELISRADNALYLAKGDGRNRVMRLT